MDETMIGAISLMRRRRDISQAQFQKHWLGVHGPLVCAMPGLQRYQQAYVTATLTAPGEVMAIDGFAQLFFASVEARAIAYASPELAACDRDSPLFIGQVTRAITEISPVGSGRSAHKLMLLLPPGEPLDIATIQTLPGLAGGQFHRVLEQGAAPNSVVAELPCPLRALAELWFTDEAALREAAVRCHNAAAYAVREHEFI
ncbi:MAG: EthD family reductase [Acetobacteraceae bacterium]|nr:EthD family reductase [Acetobacteraceae bacterium]